MTTAAIASGLAQATSPSPPQQTLLELVQECLEATRSVGIHVQRSLSVVEGEEPLPCEPLSPPVSLQGSLKQLSCELHALCEDASKLALKLG